ncbi:hypothetical protein ACSBR2_040722 [Camellia fascicularis]
MAAELGLLSLTHLQKLAQSTQSQKHQPPQNPSSTTGSWMWNPKQNTQEDIDDDSWEVRAFAEDTNHAMGTTWPPRSYTCTFCRREFRSAQALGGHMNVHRRDRARLHQLPPGLNGLITSSSTASSSTLIIPTQELVANGGLCLFYSLPNPNPNGVFAPAPYPTMPPCPASINFPVTSPSINSSLCHSSNTEPSASIDNDNNQNNNSSAIEELDLELRLGCSS